MVTPNNRTVNIKLTRKELCNVLIVLDAVDNILETDHKELHDKLKKQLLDHDNKWLADDLKTVFGKENI